jgi:hypothetical protein
MPTRRSQRVPHRARGTTGRPGGVLSPPRSAGSNSPAIGLPGEENRGLPEDFTLLAQVPDLTAQPAQLLALGRGEAVAAPASVQVGALDLLADRGLGQVQLTGDLADRLTRAVNQLDDLGLVLRREEPAWSWHRTPISRAGPSSWVSTRPDQLQVGAASTAASCWCCNPHCPPRVSAATKSDPTLAAVTLLRSSPTLEGRCCHVMGHVTVCHMELPKAATPTRDLPADRPPWHRVQSAAAGPSSLEGRAIAGLAAGQPAPDRPLRAPRRPPHRIPAPGLRADLRPQAPTVVKPALRDFLCSASAARAAWPLDELGLAEPWRARRVGRRHRSGTLGRPYRRTTQGDARHPTALATPGPLRRRPAR